MMKNIRFQEYINHSWVTLTMKPGESLSWDSCGPTDEGWFRLEKTWRYDGTAVEPNVGRSAISAPRL